MNYKVFISIILVFVISISLMGVALGAYDIRDESDLPLSEKEILEMIDNNTPSTNVDYFNKATLMKDGSIIAVSGTMPKKSGIESYDWGITLQKIAEEIQKDESFEKYMKAYGGPIIGFSVCVDGYMTVMIDTETKLTEEDIKFIQSLFEKHAANLDVKDVPLIINYSKGVQYQTINPPIADPSTFLIKYRPIIGGSLVTESFGSRGTIGYTVIGTNNSNSTKGFITAAHLLPRNVSGMIYQGDNTQANETVYATNNQSTNDALYVKYTSIDPIIHVGQDPVLAANASRKSANKTKMVVYGSTAATGVNEVRWYGGSSGNSVGYHYAYQYNVTTGDGKILDTIGLLGGDSTQGGDSGGPIYVPFNVTLGSGKNATTDYQAFIVGSIVGTVEYNGQEYVGYTPKGEVEYYLNLKPYTVSGKYLT